jgi:ribosome-binding factor A
MNQIKLKRIGSEIAQELSKICATEAHDELLKTITITGTEVTNDLGLCKVFFTSTLDKDHKLIEKDLNDETSSYLRSLIASRIEIRHTPKIRFVYDNSVAYGNKIEKLIEEIHEKDGE